MIGLVIRFDLGRYHANPWGAHVNDAAIEWPPSPWRLIRALFATSRTHVPLRDRVQEVDRALLALVAAPPPVFELPPSAAAHTRHFMPSREYSAARPKKTDKILDGFIALDPEATLRVWWDASLDADASDALAQVARRLGYLGRSESVCSAELVAGTEPQGSVAAPADPTAVEGDGGELVELLCPEPGASLDQIAVSVTAMRAQRLLLPPGIRRVSYLVPKVETGRPVSARNQRRAPRPQLALLRLHSSNRPAITEAVAVGQALRAALQHRYGRRSGGEASPTFSGRVGDRRRMDQHRHAHYLALPDRHGRRVDRLFVWAPEGFGADEVASLADLDHLTMHGIEGPMPCALAALGRADELDIPDLLGPARTWRSRTAFGLVRHPKVRRGQTLDSPAEQVRQELEHRSFPEPIEISLEQGSWHRFRSSKAGLSRLERARVVGARIAFAQAVAGPLALGALSHFGLGLFTPER